MSRIVPIFPDFLGLSRLHFGLTKGSDRRGGAVRIALPMLNNLTYHKTNIATLGSNLDSESKLSSEEPEWVIKSPW